MAAYRIYDRQGPSRPVGLLVPVSLRPSHAVRSSEEHSHPALAAARSSVIVSESHAAKEAIGDLSSAQEPMRKPRAPVRSPWGWATPGSGRERPTQV
jgi:hypothetical protein